jgi:photosystem II stability/assembly factor-like uncharacterized protein
MIRFFIVLVLCVFAVGCASVPRTAQEREELRELLQTLNAFQVLKK